MSGEAQLADFALHLRPVDGTRRARVVPTPAYASPEVLRGAHATVASDIYSFAATLVTLVHGRGPHSRHVGEDMLAVMDRVLTKPPADLRPSGVPDEMCDILEWGLEKEPCRRPSSAAVIGKALQGLQRRLGLEPTHLQVLSLRRPTSR